MSDEQALPADDRLPSFDDVAAEEPEVSVLHEQDAVDRVADAAPGHDEAQDDPAGPAGLDFRDAISSMQVVGRPTTQG